MLFLEIFPVAALGGDRFLQIFHAVDFILLSKLIELFYHFGLDVDAMSLPRCTSSD